MRFSARPSRPSRHLRRSFGLLVAGSVALMACGDDAEDADADQTAAESDSAESASEPVGSNTTPVASTTPDTAAPDTTLPATAAPDATSTDAGWSFTDDLGQVVELETVPDRIVMFEDVAASLMDLGVRPVGIHYIQGAGENQLFDGLDVEGIAEVGHSCDTPNFEAVAAADPDVLIYMNWGEPAGEAFCLSSDQVTKLTAIAPIISIRAEGSADEILERYVELAGALGADLDSPDITAKRERYEAAAARLEAAVAARPEISVIPSSISPEWAGVAEPGGFADLVMLRDQFGVDYATPFEEPFTGTYWQEYSGETLADIRGDVIMIDSKNATPMDLKLEAYPLWAALPEVAAGQIVPWFVPGSFSYTRDATAMELLAEAIENAQDFVQ